MQLQPLSITHPMIIKHLNQGIAAPRHRSPHFGYTPADNFDQSNSALSHQLRNFVAWANQTWKTIQETQSTQIDSSLPPSETNWRIVLPQAQVASQPTDPRRIQENRDTIRLYEKTFNSFFITGEECSNPTIQAGNQTVRWDQLAMLNLNNPVVRAQHIALMKRLGIENIRLGIQNHLIADEGWERLSRRIELAERYHLKPLLSLLKRQEKKKMAVSTDLVRDFKKAGIKTLVDLQHFGLPDYVAKPEDPEHSDYLNPDWPEDFARFAMSVVRTHFDDMDAITIINEPMVTNSFSGNHWNERFPGWGKPLFDHYFIERAINIAKASTMARTRIEAFIQSKPDPEKARKIFLHNEAVDYRVDNPDSNKFFRFLTSDLMLGQDWLLNGDLDKLETPGVKPEDDMLRWLERRYVRPDHPEDREKLVSGLKDIRKLHTDFESRFNKTMKADTVFGVDYYMTNESGVMEPETNRHVNGLQPWMYAADMEHPTRPRKGLYGLAMEYWNRYHLPMQHTETNMSNAWGPKWYTQQKLEWAQLSQSNVPILGFTVYSLMHQRGWEKLMNVHPDLAELNEIGMADPRDPEGNGNFKLSVYAQSYWPAFRDALNRPS